MSIVCPHCGDVSLSARRVSIVPGAIIKTHPHDDGYISKGIIIGGCMSKKTSAIKLSKGSVVWAHNYDLIELEEGR